MKKDSTISTIFTLIIIVASIYFFYDNIFWAAVILLIWGLSRLFGSFVDKLVTGVRTITIQAEAEKRANAVIEIKVNIAELLNHEELATLFEKLKKSKKPNADSKDVSVEKLIENFKKIYKDTQEHTYEGKRYLWARVKFNIKNNLLWKDGQIDFNDSIYQEWFIPYEYTSEKEEAERWSHKTTEGITIRALLVNGIVKLQVGNFNKELSPKIIRDGLAVYQTWVTITSFPLIYCLLSHNIPSGYFNLSLYATDSYRDVFHGVDKNIDSRKDWKEINQEIAEYSYVTNLAEDDTVPDQAKFDEIIKKFNDKRTAMLTKEDFKDPYAKNKEDGYYDPYFEDGSLSFYNPYMDIFVANLNEYKEKRARYTFPDYYEERP